MIANRNFEHSEPLTWIGKLPVYLATAIAGVLAITMPAHHVFYGVITLAVAVYSLVGVNLGGFLVGMLLGCVGGVLVVAWMPRSQRRARRPARAPEP